LLKFKLKPELTFINFPTQMAT